VAHILLIDDEPAITAVLGTFFRRNGGHTTTRAHSGQDGIALFRELRPDIVMLDVRMPDASGFEVLDALHEFAPVVIMMTGHADVALAVEAMQKGAENFLTKPLDFSHLAAVVDRALDKVRLRQLNDLLRTRRDRGGIEALLGPSAPMAELARQVELLASSDRTTALLLGETGTGKRRLAEVMHGLSPRAAGAFVAASCAALVGRDAAGLDAELFGTLDGRPGIFDVATGGTVLLEEVADLPPELQPRLLELLDSGRFRRAGGADAIMTDVRIIAAASRDLVIEVNAGRFREDLYYRLSVMPVHLPPLRARPREDVAAITGSLLAELQQEVPDAPAVLDDDALEALLRYPWPGNMRELRNALERALLLARGSERVQRIHLPPEVRGGRPDGLDAHTPRTLAEVERAHIHRTLQANRLNRTHTARELGISRATLIKKIREYGLAYVGAARSGTPKRVREAGDGHDAHAPGVARRTDAANDTDHGDGEGSGGTAA